MHFLTNLCHHVHTSSSQHVRSWRHLLFPNLKCFWWGIQAHHPNPFSKPRDRHCFLWELNLATVSELTPREKLPYDMIHKKESVSCKLRKKYRQNLKFVSVVEVNTLMDDISTSLNAESIRLLKSIFRNSKHKPKGRRCSFEDTWLASSLLKCSSKSFSFLRVMLSLP
jgi:hypothetical protein